MLLRKRQLVDLFVGGQLEQTRKNTTQLRVSSCKQDHPRNLSVICDDALGVVAAVITPLLPWDGGKA